MGVRPSHPGAKSCRLTIGPGASPLNKYRLLTGRGLQGACLQGEAPPKLVLLVRLLVLVTTSLLVLVLVPTSLSWLVPRKRGREGGLILGAAMFRGHLSYQVT